jgi:hypothetical protein
VKKRGLTPFLVLLLIAPLLAQPPQAYRILMTNDDGVKAVGLLALVDVLRPLGETTAIH